MNDIKISACIPTYNRAGYLKCTIRSLLNQSVPVDEIIVVDDGSTDNTKQVVESFGLTEKIRYYKFQRDEGKPRHLTIVDIFNYCVERASCEFVSIIGDDDLVAHNWSEVVKNSIAIAGNSETRPNIFYFSYSIIDERNRIRRIWLQVNEDKALSGMDVYRKTNMLFGALGNFVCKKDFFSKQCPYSTESATFFDKDFYARLGLLDTPVYFSKKNIFFCRSHIQQTSRLILHGAREELQKINSFYENSRYICKINDRYRDFFIEYDPGFRYLSQKKYFNLFGTLFKNSVFYKEISFLFLQGIYKALGYKKPSIYMTNLDIIRKYFPQITSLTVKVFLIAYFIRYWIGFIDIKGRILAWLQFKKDVNLSILPD